MDQGARVNEVGFSPDGQHVITASDDESVRVWLAGTSLNTPEIAGGADDSSTFFTRRNRGFVKLNGRNSLAIWSIVEPRVDLRALPESLRSAALSPNAELLATAGVGDIVHVEDVFSKRQTASLAHPGQIDWSEYQRRVEKRGLSYRDPMATITQKGRAEREGTVDVRGFSEDGRYLVTTRRDFVARVWDVAAQRVVVSEPYEFSISASAFSPGGRFVAFVKDATDLTAFDLPSGRKVMSTRAATRFASLSVTDGVLAVVEEAPAGGSQNRVHLWRSGDWRMLPSLDLDEQSGEDIVLSPNSEYLAAGLGSTAVRVIHVRTGKEQFRVRTEGTVDRVVFSPEARLMAVAGEDKTLRIWDLSRNHELARLAHNEPVFEVSFSPNGLNVAAGGPTLTRIFSLPSGYEGTRLVSDSPVRRIQFEGNGQYVATTGEKSTRIWLWRPPDLIDEACALLNRGLSSTQWPSVVGEPLSTRITRVCRGTGKASMGSPGLVVLARSQIQASRSRTLR
jgi:hypothetical protein